MPSPVGVEALALSCGDTSSVGAQARPVGLDEGGVPGPAGERFETERAGAAVEVEHPSAVEVDGRRCYAQ